MNLDIVLAWMKTFNGTVTPGVIQRNFGVGIWYANRVYDLLVKGGHVKDERRLNHIIKESKREAAEEMYDLLAHIYSVDPRSSICMEIIGSIPELLKKARGE